MMYNASVLSVNVFMCTVFDPRHDKTCLRVFPTRPDTNRPARPQKLTRLLKFRLMNLDIYYLSREQQRC